MEIISLLPVICDYLDLNNVVNVYNAFYCKIQKSESSEIAEKAIKDFEIGFKIDRKTTFYNAKFFFTGKNSIYVKGKLHMDTLETNFFVHVLREKVNFYKRVRFNYPVYSLRDGDVLYHQSAFYKKNGNIEYEWKYPYLKVIANNPDFYGNELMDYVDFEKGKREVSPSFMSQNEYFKTSSIHMENDANVSHYINISTNFQMKSNFCLRFDKQHKNINNFIPCPDKFFIYHAFLT